MKQGLISGVASFAESAAACSAAQTTSSLSLMAPDLNTELFSLLGP